MVRFVSLLWSTVELVTILAFQCNVAVPKKSVPAKEKRPTPAVGGRVK